MNPFRGILFFSAIETITVVVWAVVLGLGAEAPQTTKIVATVVLFIGYVIEHVVAFNVGKNRPFFSFPQP